MWQIVRSYSFKPLTLSLLKKLEPYYHEYNKLQEDILHTVSEGKDSSSISKMQISASQINSYAEAYTKLKSLTTSIDDLEVLATDKSMEQEAMDEINDKLSELEDVESTAVDLLLPVDPDDKSNAIIELRPGVGGSESCLFCEDLLNMFTGYAEHKGWNTEILSISRDIQIGKGCKEATLKIEGEGAYGKLKYEAGVHKVIRVPETEAKGRLHSSTASVVILPEEAPDDFKINEKDVRQEFTRSRGAGGQHVNKTESAVKLTHIPTGITAQCQDERDQNKNKESAWRVLRARIYAIEKQKKEQETQATRLSQKGTGDRSEKIRTYNWPQDRITDHRFNFTMHGIGSMLQGGLLDSFIEQAEAQKHNILIQELINNKD